MKFKKNGYTLLEIMIVLGVIIAIMAITMRFSSSRIDDLQSQTNKDEFKNSYEQLLLGNMSSNYHNEERYETLEIKMQSGNNGFSYTLKNEVGEIQVYTGFFSAKQKISKITTNNEEQQIINIQLLPYKIGCTINNEKPIEAIVQTQEKNKTHCFKITTEMCKLEHIPCPQF